MSSLFRFLYRFRAFLLFLFYEFVAFGLIFNQATYQASAYFNFTKELSGDLYSFTNGIKDYVKLKTVNDELALENAIMRKQIDLLNGRTKIASQLNTDSLYLKSFEFIPARVVNNSTQRINNLITIDKGLKDGLRPGMGVISGTGIVGRVKVCSENYATIVSLLHSESMISSKIKKDNSLGSTVWEETDSRYAKLKFIPRHIAVNRKDTIVTTGFSTVFPEGIMVGVIDEIKQDNDKNFHDIRIKLSTNFNSLSYVYVVKSLKVKELEQLEQKTKGESF